MKKSMFLALVTMASSYGCSVQTELEPTVEEVIVHDLPTNYLVVAHSQLEASAKRYADFRASSGYSTEVILWDTLTGNSPQEAIRDAIQLRYQEKASDEPFFVLILGDASVGAGQDMSVGPQVPVFVTEPDYEVLETFGRFAETVVSDNFYADMDGDHRPDLAIGRLPVSSDAEVDSWRHRVADFENTHRPGPWNNDVMMFASSGDFGEDIDGVLTDFAFMAAEAMSTDFDIHFTEGRQGSDFTYVPEELSERVYDQLNAGSVLSMYVGHGLSEGLAWMNWNGERHDILDTRFLERDLHIDTRSPIMSLVACSTGAFTQEDPGLAERLLRDEQGPIAVMASTSISHPLPNALFALGLGTAVMNDRVPTIGEAFLNTKADILSGQTEVHQMAIGVGNMMVPEGERDELWRIHHHMYTLMGDPGTRFPLPEDLELTVSPSEQEVKIALADGRHLPPEVTISVEVPSGIHPGTRHQQLHANKTSRGECGSFQLGKQLYPRAATELQHKRQQFLSIRRRPISVRRFPNQTHRSRAPLHTPLESVFRREYLLGERCSVRSETG